MACLGRTPALLDGMLRGLPDEWLATREGEGTWNALEVLGHLIHGEETDWIPRAEIILTAGETRAFEPFDRTAMLARFPGWSCERLLDRFAELRAANLARLRSWQLATDDLARRGRHPELGSVTLGELLATWMVHDLAHQAQIARALACSRRAAVGPWKAYFRALSDR